MIGLRKEARSCFDRRIVEIMDLGEEERLCGAAMPHRV